MAADTFLAVPGARTALQADFVGTNKLVLAPCINIWETNDTYWVQADGKTPNTIMDANFYVQNDTLVNTNVVFIGACITNTLTANPEPLTGVSYTSVAFIKIFDGGYDLIGESSTNLTNGQSFSISMDTTGAAHVQYGFETEGPDANPATYTNLGNVVIAVPTAPDVVTVDPTQNWIGYMNVFALPASGPSPLGGAYEFGTSWATALLTADFIGNNTELMLAPCTNVWETNDTYWVQADGMTPNKIMDASMYVQNDSLINTNLVFIGSCINNTLTPDPLTGIAYTCDAFIKIFDGSFNLLGSATSPPIGPGDSFGISLSTTGAAHVQYGFETIGPDANPATVNNLGNVLIASQAPPVTVPTPSNNAPTPTRPAAAVLAMYDSSGVYPIHPVEDWLAGWSSAAQSSYTIPGTGRVVLKYSALQYAGVEFYDTNHGINIGGTTNYTIDATNYDTFHVDIWTPNANQFGVQLVSLDNSATQAAQVNYAPGGAIVEDQWVGLDIPLSQFTATNNQVDPPGIVDLGDLQQLLWIDNQAGGGVIGGTFYIDNVYFYNSTFVVAQPTLMVSLAPGGNVQLSFQTQSSGNYTVQYKTNLTDATWQTLTTVSGNGALQSVPDSVNQTSRFYRLWVH